MEQPIIELTRVGVRYRMPNDRIPSLKEYAVRKLRRQISYHEFWALHDVSLAIQPGEVFGIVGANGAGKSTLLKVIARVVRPSRGEVYVGGRVAPLLELGAGFDFELTGRENIFLNSAVLGFSQRDTATRFDRIVEFAGLREFIEMPLRTYSTGMVARLGFAIATDVQPDILIVDEILSVGDASFRDQSAQRILNIQRNGATILVVSHNLDSIKTMCARAAWLVHGQLKVTGRAGDIVEAYRRQSEGS